MFLQVSEISSQTPLNKKTRVLTVTGAKGTNTGFQTHVASPGQSRVSISLQWVTSETVGAGDWPLLPWLKTYSHPT